MNEDQNSSQTNHYIDLVDVLNTIWQKRIWIIKWCIAGALVGIIIAFSMPKEYATYIKVNPENVTGNKTNQLGSIAAMAGVTLNSSGNISNDVLYPELYPDIIQSTPFLLEFIQVPVQLQKDTSSLTFYEYLSDYQKIAWWNYITGVPFKIIGWISSVFHKHTPSSDMEIDPFRLTRKQEVFIETLQKRLSLSIDDQSGVVTACVVMQDPLVSARTGEIFLMKLQQYIIDYRTRKARHDLAFSEHLFKEARENYYKNQQIYARYIDENRNVTVASYKTEAERLRNEMNLAYNVYTQMAHQVEMDKIKVQEQTPVFTVLEPAKVPLEAVKPNKILILFVSIVLAGATSIGLIFVKSVIRSLKN